MAPYIYALKFICIASDTGVDYIGNTLVCFNCSWIPLKKIFRQLCGTCNSTGSCVFDSVLTEKLLDMIIQRTVSISKPNNIVTHDL